MSGPPIKRRRTKAIGPDSSIFAKALTHKTITTTNRSGVVVKKDVLVPLVPNQPPQDNTGASSSTLPSNDDKTTPEYASANEGNMDVPFLNDNEDSFASSNPNKTKVGICNLCSFISSLNFFDI